MPRLRRKFRYAWRSGCMERKNTRNIPKKILRTFIRRISKK